jgi:hypothetical protein
LGRVGVAFGGSKVGAGKKETERRLLLLSSFPTKRLQREKKGDEAILENLEHCDQIGKKCYKVIKISSYFLYLF